MSDLTQFISTLIILDVDETIIDVISMRLESVTHK